MTRAPSHRAPGVLLRSCCLVLLPLLLAAGCGSTGTGGKDAAAAGASTSSACAYPEDGTPAKKVELPPSEPKATQPTSVTLLTTAGRIPITLEADKAPCTVNSFLSLAEQDYFDGTSCHRLTTAGIFVLQCGDPTATGMGGPGYRFDDELWDDDPRIQPCHQQQTATSATQVCTYGAGTVAMANAGPDTNGSQFFLVYDSSPLPPDYTVFGRMDAAGLKTVRQVAAAGVGRGAATGTDGAPRTPVTINDVKLPDASTGAGS